MAIAGVMAALLMAGTPGAPEAKDTRFGLMSSLPIYRMPQASVADALVVGGDATGVHWLRRVVEANNSLDPVDMLDPAGLARLDTLLLIQPRALTPAENVALDDWVRAGGKVLLVADPMLVSEPTFALGDPRNPQAIAVSGPILARWGLTLESEVDARHRADPGIGGDDPGIERDGTHRHADDEMLDLEGATIPVTLGGHFALRAPAGGAPADCELREARLIAVCDIGEGRAVLLADATMFERSPAPSDAPDAFWALMGMVRDEPGE
ncbi:DUF4350 domain-containing protein [Alteriqipengyuania lutimaris]|uniref:DUF4350 domain-containing protein n=1 Tax=Alteriqipengyuania lutimaris TaxID=1538146 RepID=A0A395LKL9_9SPHN|nr:DUF4350 domain-containing protein [Alteriqipengyuania lutimaris]MBB3033399.1 hypothetical protein [Alteriqipengyuania lutimaris]RDS77576.1 hypothetical protein DL238_08140 [Alteriqipengyuania lutimaris]